MSVCVSDVERREREKETREREMETLKETLKAKLVNSNATIDTLQQGPKKKETEKGG